MGILTSIFKFYSHREKLQAISQAVSKAVSKAVLGAPLWSEHLCGSHTLRSSERSRKSFREFGLGIWQDQNGRAIEWWKC